MPSSPYSKAKVQEIESSPLSESASESDLSSSESDVYEVEYIAGKRTKGVYHLNCPN